MKQTPSKKEWGSVSDNCAKQCLGILCHNILPRVAAESFGRWENALPDLGDADAPPRGVDPEAYRKYSRRKTWRAVCCLQSEHNLENWCVRSWALEPIDRLLMRLQWLDARDKALLDCLSPARSPFQSAMRHFTSCEHWFIQLNANPSLSNIIQLRPNSLKVRTV